MAVKPVKKVKKEKKETRTYFRVRPMRDLDYWKPQGCKDWLTLKELSEHVQRDMKWLRILEREGRIPKAIRIKRGKLEIRLWSPEQAKEVELILQTLKPGRPRS